MQIVIEYVLIENIIINFFILKSCEHFLKEKASLKFLNSLFGAIVSLCFPLFSLSYVGVILLKILVGSVMICISFSFKNLSQFFYKYFAFALMTFVFGGAVEALSQITTKLSVVLILLFGLLIWKGIMIAKNAPDEFSALTATGITAIIAVQVLMNIAVVTSSMPVTGITLPFFSYGGTSLVILLIGVGILLNISRYSGK